MTSSKYRSMPFSLDMFGINGTEGRDVEFGRRCAVTLLTYEGVLKTVVRCDQSPFTTVAFGKRAAFSERHRALGSITVRFKRVVKRQARFIP